MALNIPIPGLPADALLRGVNTGGGLYSRIMQPILEREQQEIRKRQLEEQKRQFAEQMGLRREQFSRSGQNMDLQRAILGEQLQNLQHKNDPNWEMNNFINFSKKLGGIENIKSNPLLRGLAKRMYGIDLDKETPEERQQAALDLFQQKENIKKQNKGGDVPTNTVLTQNQQALQGINTVLPMLDELINSPEKIYGRFDFSPSKKAAYNAKTSGMIDTLVAAQSLPKVQASIDLVEQQIRRATNEGDDAYIERLKDLKKDLILRREKSESLLKTRKVNTGKLEDFSHMSNEELMKIAGGE
jgi:hypothetical protein